MRRHSWTVTRLLFAAILASMAAPSLGEDNEAQPERTSSRRRPKIVALDKPSETAKAPLTTTSTPTTSTPTTSTPTTSTPTPAPIREAEATETNRVASGADTDMPTSPSSTAPKIIKLDSQSTISGEPVIADAKPEALRDALNAKPAAPQAAPSGTQEAGSPAASVRNNTEPVPSNEESPAPAVASPPQATPQLEPTASGRQPPSVKPRGQNGEAAKPETSPSPVVESAPAEVEDVDTSSKTGGEPAAPVDATEVLIQPERLGDPDEDAAWSTVKRSDVRASIFQGISPGDTPAEKVVEALGEPMEKKGKAWIYQLGPFPKIEVTIEEDKVASVVIQLDQPASVQTVREELALGSFESAPIRDSQGNQLGAAFPERGIVLSFARLVKPHAVSQIMLEPINAELFLLRARERQGNFQDQIADLRFARSLAGSLAEADSLEAKVNVTLGRVATAAKLAERAVSQSSDNPEYVLQFAELKWATGNATDARDTALELAGNPQIADLTRAAARNLLGEMVAQEHANYQGAFEHHLQAIQLAKGLAESQNAATRRKAKQILADAHLRIASNIAWGEWRDKEDVVPKWTQIGRSAARNLVAQEGLTKTTELTALRRILGAYSSFQTDIGQNEIADQAIKLAEALVDQEQDVLEQRALRWEAAEIYYYAARCKQRLKQFDEALQLGAKGAEIVEAAFADVEPTSRQRYLAARILFEVGSVHAIHKRNHNDAASWYDKALAYLHVVDGERVRSSGGIGDRLVSMGVSFWQSGQRDKALKTTKSGAAVLEFAVENGYRGKKSLSIPYNNLASMYEVLGEEKLAAEYAKLAQEVEAKTEAAAAPASARNSRGRR